MKFGLAIDFGSDREPLADRLRRVMPLIRRAERLGFETVAAGEQYPSSSSYFHLPSPMLVLAALAPQTRMHLCTGVTLLTAWSPLRLAYDSAVLDQLSEGRFILGAAAGGEPIWKKFGQEREGLSGRLDETVEALRALWSGSEGFAGRYVEIAGAIRPLPVSEGGPPIWLGGLAPRALRRAARLADGWYGATNYRLDTEITPAASLYRSQVGAAGDDRHDIVVNRLCVIAPTQKEATTTARRYVEPVLQAYASFGALKDADGQPMGAREDLLTPLRDALTLVGDSAAINERLEEYARAGVTQVQLRVQPSQMPPEIVAQTIELAGSEVIPRWS